MSSKNKSSKKRSKALSKGLITALILCLGWANVSLAQQMSINTNGALPDSSAMLDVKSTAKGILIPRMTAAQKTAIVNPADGLIIFQTNGSKGLHTYDVATTTWKHILDSAGVAALISSSDYWNNNGSGIKTDSIVGIGGTANPTFALTINADSLNNFGILQYSNPAKYTTMTVRTGGGSIDKRVSFGMEDNVGTNANNLSVGTYPAGGTGWTNPLRIELGAPTNTIFVDSNGNTGFNTTAPSTRLTIFDTTNSTLLITSSESLTPSNSVNSGSISMMETSEEFSTFGGYGFQMGYDGASNKLRFRANNGTTIDTAVTILRGNGFVGIGADSPNSPLHIKSESARIALEDKDDSITLLISAPNPTSGATGGIGTNDSIGFPFYTNGVDQMWIGANGNIGIGTTTPETKLSILDTEKAALIKLQGQGDAFSYAGIQLFSNEEPDKSWSIFHRRLAAEKNGLMFQHYDGSVYTQPLFIDDSNRVGINNLSPNANLDVTGLLRTNTLTINNEYTLPTTDGTNGQVMQTDGSGIVTWQTLSAGSDGNGLYDASGSLSGNTVVTQGANTLDFTSTATDGFSVDGTTFSVDAANNRVGIGTASPTDQVHAQSTGFVRFRAETSSNQFAGFVARNTVSAVNNEYFMGVQGFGDPNPGEFHIFQNAPNVGQRMVIDNIGRVGIGMSDPAHLLDVGGTASVDVLNINSAFTFPSTDGTNGQVMQTDGSGNVAWQTPAIGSSDEIADADNDTKIQVEESADEDIIRFDMAGSEFFRMKSGRLEIVNTGKSVFLGDSAGFNDDLSDNENVFIGDKAGLLNSSGAGNVALGSSAYNTASTASGNAVVGWFAGTGITTGSNNTLIGAFAAPSLSTGEFNVALGNSALINNQFGDNNLALGYSAGQLNSGSGNIFLGNEAGANWAGSNALFIDNSNAANPLIYGDFAADSLVLNGNVNITGNVGIGTTTPKAQFQVDSFLIFSSKPYDGVRYMGFNAYDDGAGDLRYINDGPVSLYTFSDDNTGLFLWPQGTADSSFSSIDPSASLSLEDSTITIDGSASDILLRVKGNGMFDSLSIHSAYGFPASDGTNGQVLQTDGSGNVSWETPTVAATPNLSAVLGAGNDAGAQAISNLSAIDVGATGVAGIIGLQGSERNALNLQSPNNADSTGISWQNSGGNYVWSIFRDQTAATGNASLVFAGGQNNATVNGLAERFRIDNNGNVGINNSAPAYLLDVNGTLSANSINVNDNFTLPTTDGTVNQVLSTNGSGLVSWVSPAAQDGNGIYSGSGSLSGTTNVTFGANQLNFITGATQGFNVDGTTFSVDGFNDRVGIGNLNPTTKLDVNGGIRSGAPGQDGQLTLYSEQGASDFTVVFDPSPSMTQNTTYTFPPNDGNASQVLTTDGSGVLSWASTSGDGNGIYDASGSLSSNTTVTQGANTLDFTTTSTDGFSVDGTTFSVDGANNRVGIGTAAPSEALQVTGSALFSSGADAVIFGSGSNSWGTIGAADGNGRFNIYENADNSGADYISSEEAHRIRMHSDGISFWSAPSGTAGNPVSWTQNLIIENTGNVVASSLLQAGSNGNDGTLRLFSEQGATDYQVTFTPNPAMTTSTAYTLPADDGGINAVLTTDGSGALSWTTPAGDGDGIYDGSGSLSGNTTVAQGANTLAFTTSAADGFSVDGTTFSVDGANNRIGIGTNSPTGDLTILSGAQNTLVLKRANNADTVGIAFQNLGTNYTGNILQGSDGDLRFKTGSNSNISSLNTRMVIENNGDVGIGISNPAYKLDVNGTFSANSINVNDVFTLPTVDGTNLQVLTTNGSGVVTWQTPSGTSEWNSTATTLSTTKDVAIGTASNYSNSKLQLLGGGLVAWGSTGTLLDASGGNHGHTEAVALTVDANASNDVLRLRNNVASDLLIVDNTGRMGMGINSPDVKLHILGGTDATVTGGGFIVTGPTTGENLVIDANEIIARSNGSSAVLYLNEYMEIEAGGPTSIGWFTAPASAHMLQVNGSIGGVGTYVNISDRRYKKDITPIQRGLNTILSLEPVSYDWRRDKFPELNFDENRGLGFIAQDVEKILPEMVTKNAEGFYSLQYSELIPVLTAAIQEQQAQIEALKAELAEANETKASLDTELDQTKTRLDANEAALAALNQKLQALLALFQTQTEKENTAIINH